mmetsp:Transcript_301/g.398  ORF Transcript_301/g.398 Transcript_301/m.398 type:complete len:136 (-) Transcript_301:1023-1430(-)
MCKTTGVLATPPPPMDDESVSDPLECPPLRWGMIGCGRVSHDFTQALKNLPTASVVACSARSEKDAEKFAVKHGISKFCKFFIMGEQDDEKSPDSYFCSSTFDRFFLQTAVTMKCSQTPTSTLFTSVIFMHFEEL